MKSNKKVEEILEKLVANTDLVEENFRGCSEKEIAELESSLGLIFPRVYRRYLRRTGRSWALLFNDTHVGFEHIIENQSRGREVFEVNEIAPPDEPIFVFSERDLERVAFFRLNGDDDPLVYGYTEDDEIRPMETLSALLSNAVESAITRYRERGTVRW